MTSFQQSAIVTEHGIAPLWGCSEQAQCRHIIEECAHPRVRDELWEEAQASAWPAGSPAPTEGVCRRARPGPRGSGERGAMSARRLRLPPPPRTATAPGRGRHGGTRGIGLAIARDLAPTHHLVIGGRSAESVADVVAVAAVG